jgi:hypothetical protein
MTYFGSCPLSGVFLKTHFKPWIFQWTGEREKMYHLMWGHERSGCQKCSKQQHYAKDQQDIKIEKYSTKIDSKPQENETYPLTGNLNLWNNHKRLTTVEAVASPHFSTFVRVFVSWKLTPVNITLGTKIT